MLHTCVQVLPLHDIEAEARGEGFRGLQRADRDSRLEGDADVHSGALFEVVKRNQAGVDDRVPVLLPRMLLQGSLQGCVGPAAGIELNAFVNSLDRMPDLDDILAQVRDLFNQFGDRHQRSIASIRKIYASMVDLAQEAGYPRDPAETPYEYRDTLYTAFPGAGEAVDAVTEAYVRTHYGEVPDTREEMNEIVACSDGPDSRKQVVVFENDGTRFVLLSWNINAHLTSGVTEAF